MKSRKIFAVLLACAIAMFSFTACGGSNKDATDPSETEAIAETSEESTTEGENIAANESEDNSESAEASVSLTGEFSPETIKDASGSQITYDEYVAQAAAAQGYEEGSDDYNAFIASAKTTYAFADDGTVTATVGEKEKQGTYEYDGASSLTTDFDGVITQYEYDKENNTLTATDESTGITIIMSKV